MDLEWWPLFGLRVRTPRLELRPFTDDMIDDYAALLDGGLHEPGEMPFAIPFTDKVRPVRQREALQFHWRTRADWHPDSWRLPFVVFEEGRMVGQQDVAADQFAICRVVTSGSWLGLAHQRRGLGTEMRAAILHFAFAGLGAEQARTEAFADNAASLGVTRKLGYQPNGELVSVRRDQATVSPQFMLTRERWESRACADVTIEGLDRAREMFGKASG